MPLWIFVSSVSKLSQRLSRSSTHSPNVPKLDSSQDTLAFKLVSTSLDLPRVAPFFPSSCLYSEAPTSTGSGVAVIVFIWTMEPPRYNEQPKL
ncbi:hypothetical protein PanWU01x14_220620 [Parasponia andersonii]|uniref:Uncharacterized protein n=1 Tax=Parasponia andersonii TaxID=3476 RepID=A0A2P5BPX7_PARAD|nr:hypothetical protein PanWU01x14_220620 [Parasponia andersonii]